MATQRPALGVTVGEFAARLLAEREVAPRAQAIAAEASRRLAGIPVAVYLFDPDHDPRWSAKASAGDITAPAQCEALTLAMVCDQREPLLLSGSELVREHYAHLDVRRTVVSLAYMPLLDDDTLLGAIEVVSMDRALGSADLDILGELAALGARALASAVAYEAERNGNFETITRLTSFYDIERVFHSTLQMSELLPIIPAKIRELLPCAAVNLWMVEDETLALMATAGADPTVEIGAAEAAVVKLISEKGKAVMLRDGSDPILQDRHAVVAGFIRGLLAVPLVDNGSLVGVIECLNKADGAVFHEDDHFLLATIAESAAGALHNASLLEAERKVEILETLVEVSNEITSTLNLDRVVQIAVNGPQRILRYDRAALAVDVKGKLRVKAVSGKTEVSQTDPAIRRMTEMLQWVSLGQEDVHISLRGDTIHTDREDTRTRFKPYFAETGMRGFFAMPLADEQGLLGVLCFESRDPDFVAEVHFEFLKVVAAQATVALRNASLYEEVPLIGVLEPLAQKKRAFQRMEKRKRVTTIALAAAAVLFLIFVPLPMRVVGDSTIAPQTTSDIQANVDGVIRNVYVREGERVAKGTVLADMEDWDYRAALAAADAKRATAEAAMNRALVSGDGTQAGIQQVEATYWAAETERARARLERTQLRSPIEGVVATPHVEALVGKRLDAGDNFARVVNTTHATVDVTVDETDLPLVEAGEKTAIKLEAFPTRKFIGRVEVVSPTSQAADDQRVFFARVDVPNPDGMIRPGMSGLAKISVGWKPAGYVAFRGIGMWAWTRLWDWFGW